ncbi:hypothetical protein WR25_08472 [Diploscapter pachys]|uniref:ATP synthase subunit b n=1 Tax=Diploscapter pachys TaxID=2018661 RepID=A0A2A2L4T2_9BILA|nr:hypothetical protein WR25_08472 [Diploscapter pachys]
MSLSRILPLGQNGRVVVLPIRFSSSHGHAVAATSEKGSGEPNFVQKIVYRFKGIPLPGEAHAPKSMFDDCDKEWFAEKPPTPMPKDYKEHPDRDLANYPYPERPMYPPKTRLLMMPDSWFTPFQKVTGVSGPYLFFGGLGAFLVNKEIWVFEEQGVMLIGWILFYLMLTRTVGYKTDKWLYGELQKRFDYYNGLIAEDLKDAVEFRKTSAAESTSLAAVKENVPAALKEAMALQLEATYRKNVQGVATELKRRLDYLKETEETKRRFEKEQMVKFITEGVEAQARDKSFKEQYLQNAIQQLKALNIQA